MYFAISCIDKPDGLALRMENRQAHLEYLIPRSNNRDS